MRTLLQNRKEYYEKMANMCARILNDEPMAQVCRENNISVPTFRGKILKNENKPVEYSAEQIMDMTEGCLSPYERIARDVLEMNGMKCKAIALFEFPEDFEETVLQLIDELDERTCECIKMYYFGEMTFTDIGRAFDLSIERIRQIIHKGIRRLRRSDMRMRLIYGNKEYNKCLATCNGKSQKESIITCVLSSLASSDDMDKIYSNLLEFIRHSKNFYEQHHISKEEGRRSIEELDLDTRTLNTLWRRRICTIGEVVNMTDSELLSLKNFGSWMLEDLDDRLASNGFKRINTRS